MVSAKIGIAKKQIIIAMICLMLISTVSIGFGLLTRPFLRPYTSHSAITIENDTDFIDYGFPGDGSESNPYRLNNLYISGGGIRIDSTTKYFEIRNCLIISSSLGIRLSYINTGACLISDNKFIIGHADGVQVRYSHNIKILNNIIRGKYRDSGDNGGIVIYQSQNCIIEDNLLFNKGIRLAGSSYCSIKNNHFFSCGLSFLRSNNYDEFSTHIVENNIVNNRPLGFFLEQEIWIIQNSFYGQLILINCDYSIIENQNIKNAFNGISLFFTDHCMISENTCNNNNGDGIYLYESEFNAVYDNICSNNLESGIFFHFSSGNTAKNNEQIGNGHHGIYLIFALNSKIQNNLCNGNSWDGIGGGNAATSVIENNICNNNIGGIDLSEISDTIIKNNTCLANQDKGIGIGYSENVEVYHNKINNTEDNYGVTGGICLLYSNEIHVYNNSCYHNGYGIKFIESDNCTTTANIMLNNKMSGMRIYYSSYYVITYNHLEVNAEFGVCLTNCSDFIIHHNNFVFNGNGSVSQSCDNGGDSNIWYDVFSNEGNFWSDHPYPGTYLIDGDSGSFDPYPFSSQIIL
jgi:parallel beta-helix repeat protein